MSQPERQLPQESETTVLHVRKFLQGQPEASSDAPDSPTLFIKRAAEDTAEKSAQPVVVPKGTALPPKQMLGAVAYAYAKGVFRSEDIERKMFQDPQFRAALNDEVPDPVAIRRFRRLNRAALLATLGKFFRWRRAQASADAPGAPAGGAEMNTQYFVKTEAEDVLNKAAWVDNMSKQD